MPIIIDYNYVWVEGSCDGMTYEEIERKFPAEFERRKTDKLAYRYPRGESYLDVIARLEPMIMEMERHRYVTHL